MARSVIRTCPLLLLLLLHAPQVSYAVRTKWWSLYERATHSNDASTRALAVYPLPAVYLPGSTVMLRNIEERNVKMAREQSVFVASLLASDRMHCATIGAVLRIDHVRAATADSSGQVLASPESSRVLMVECTVVGRAELLRCDNLEAWSTRETYLMADVCEFDDEGDADGVDEALQEDVEDAIYKLVDALLLESDAATEDTVIDATAAVAALEEAASHVSAGRWWEALELWQRHCATRAFALQAQHQAERNEFVIDAKLREGGVLQIPVQEHTLSDEDRRKLLDLDVRAKEALEQMGLDDSETFQACLETRSERERAELLREGVLREAGRLDRRAALQRALDAS